MEYRIHTNNKFAAIETEEEEMDVDPLETLKKLSDQLAVKKTALKKAPTGVAKTEKSKVAKPLEQPSNKANNVKTQRTARPNNDYKPSNDSNTEQRPERNGFKDNRGGPPKRGGFRGARTGAEGGRHREFDRHSGNDKSGVKAHDKREGGGAHNWGSAKDDINEHMNNAGAANPSESTPQKSAFMPDEAAPAMSAEEIAEKEAKEAEREAEERQMTLAEWKKQQEDKRLKSTFNIRKPNEGSSETAKWKKMFVLKKKSDEDEEEEEEEDEEEEEEHEDRKAKHVVPIKITFADSRNQGNNRRGTPRGGMRGGGRGGRGGGRFGGDGFKPHNKVAAVPNVDDEKDFPSLS